MKISIITVCYQNRDGLEKTIKSVMEQDYDQIEFIVIDGGSDDGSKELISDSSDIVDFWVSQKDKGIYHAMNFGINQATGDYTIFMNGGDVFHDKQVLSDIVQLNPKWDIIYGDCLITGRRPSPYVKKMPDVLDFLTLMSFTVTHQVILYSTEYLKKRTFDTSYEIIADWVHFNTAILEDKVTYHHIDRLISIYDGTGFSSDAAQLKRREAERTGYYQSIIPDILSEKLNRRVKLKVGKFRSPDTKSPSWRF